jgi:hypothetical protein
MANYHSDKGGHGSGFLYYRTVNNLVSVYQFRVITRNNES